jgi:hypothetical protein
MNRPGRSIGAQFDEPRDRSRRSRVHGSPSIRSAATGKNKRAQNEGGSCYNPMRFRHEGQFGARLPSVNGKLRLGKTPTMVQTS